MCRSLQTTYLSSSRRGLKVSRAEKKHVQRPQHPALTIQHSLTAAPLGGDGSFCKAPKSKKPCASTFSPVPFIALPSWLVAPPPTTVLACSTPSSIPLGTSRPAEYLRSGSLTSRTLAPPPSFPSFTDAVEGCLVGGGGGGRGGDKADSLAWPPASSRPQSRDKPPFVSLLSPPSFPSRSLLASTGSAVEACLEGGGGGGG